MTRFPRIFLLSLLLALLFAAVPVHAAGLNDTGQTLCDTGYSPSRMVACTTANSGDGAIVPRQDGRFGRDPAAAAGQLTKIGAGAAGFDFTKVCMNGTLNCAGAASNAAAPAATEWACTKDNNTNLIWSLQTQIDTWANATSTLPTAANTATRCGFNSGWRLPTRRELLSIVHNGAFRPAIDAAYFPGTVSTGTGNDFYWSADTYAPDPASAWRVNFDNGDTNAFIKGPGYPVRLVRSGQ